MPDMSAQIPTHFSLHPAGAAVVAMGGASRRARRVVVLLSGIIALSAADLLATIAHLRIGMIEGNPLARYIIETTQSMSALAAFKVATVLVCVGLLYRLRCSMQGEVAAWTAVVILSALSIWWGVASEELTGSDAVSSQLREHAAAATTPAQIVSLPAP